MRWQRNDIDDEQHDSEVVEAANAASRTLQIQSFLEYLFQDAVKEQELDDEIEAHNRRGQQANQTTLGSGGMVATALLHLSERSTKTTPVAPSLAPSLVYAAAVARETMKPFHMNATPTIDQCVLTTRTAPSIVTDCSRALERHQQGATPASAATAATGATADDGRKGVGFSDARWLREREYVAQKDAHLASLKDAIHQAQIESRWQIANLQNRVRPRQ